MSLADIFNEKVKEPFWILSLNDIGGTVLHSTAAVGDLDVVRVCGSCRDD